MLVYGHRMTGTRVFESDEPSRGGQPWTDADHVQLIECLTAGLTDEEVGAVTGRSLGALRSRARMMLGDRLSGGGPLTQLREILLENPDYRWQDAVQLTAARAGGHYWTDDEETVLSAGWVSATPMRVLVEQLGLPEQSIARQLIALGLATSTVEVADRLGYLPGGVLQTRRRLILDRVSYTLTCLILITAGEVSHISLHPDRQSAEDAREQVLATDGFGEARWVIADRWPGGLDAGATIAG